MMLEPKAPTVSILGRQHLCAIADVEVDLGDVWMPLFQRDAGRLQPFKHRCIRGFDQYQREIKVRNPDLGLASCDAAIQINPVQAERGLGQGCADIREQRLELNLYGSIGDGEDIAVGIDARGL